VKHHEAKPIPRSVKTSRERGCVRNSKKEVKKEYPRQDVPGDQRFRKRVTREKEKKN